METSFMCVQHLNVGDEFFTHGYCAGHIAWFLPVVYSGTPQEKGSNKPGDGTKEETDYESSKQGEGGVIVRHREKVFGKKIHSDVVIQCNMNLV
jgi:sugar phosphate permease